MSKKNTETELNALLEELADVQVNSDDEDGPPPPPPPRDSLVFESPLEEARRQSKRVSVSGGKASYPEPPARDDDDGRFGGSDRFDERGDDRFDEPAPPKLPEFEPIREPEMKLDVRCVVCRKNIEGDALQVLGGLYHFTCFACNGCGNKVGTDEFFDRDNKPYCVVCYKKSFLPKCTRCFKSIEGRYLKALNKDFHEACFNCAVCHVAFQDGKFYEKDENAYCLKHFNELFGYTCGKCHGVINDGTAIKALSKYWHREHFNCGTCGKAFSDNKFFEIDGQPYCQDHYHQKKGTVCGKCSKNIDGKCVRALDKNWHPECFVCAKCRAVLKGKVAMDEGQVYCEPCANTL